MTTRSLQIMILLRKFGRSRFLHLVQAFQHLNSCVDLCACARAHAGMRKPLSNPFRPAASRNLKPSCETDEFARSAVSETNFHHAPAFRVNLKKQNLYCVRYSEDEDIWKVSRGLVQLCSSFTCNKICFIKY